MSLIRADTTFTLWIPRRLTVVNSFFTFILLCVESKLHHLICTVVTEHWYRQRGHMFIPITQWLVITGDPMEVLWWKWAMWEGNVQPQCFPLFLPSREDTGLKLSSETKLKDLRPLCHGSSVHLSLTVGCLSPPWDGNVTQLGGIPAWACTEEWRCVWHISSDS